MTQIYENLEKDGERIRYADRYYKGKVCFQIE